MRKPDIWNCSKSEWEVWENSPEGAAEKSQERRIKKKIAIIGSQSECKR